MKFGAARTEKGHVACVLEEDGTPLMVVTKPFAECQAAWQSARILEASKSNKLAALAVGALRRAGVFEPLAAVALERAA